MTGICRVSQPIPACKSFDLWPKLLHVRRIMRDACLRHDAPRGRSASGEQNDQSLLLRPGIIVSRTPIDLQSKFAASQRTRHASRRRLIPHNDSSLFLRNDSPAKHTEDGMALVELLVALALLATMTVLLLTAIGSGRQVLNTAEQRLLVPGGAAFEASIRTLLTGVRPVLRKRHSYPGSGDHYPVFTGTTTQWRSTTLIEVRGHYAGLYYVHMKLMPAAQNGQSIDVVLTPHRPTLVWDDTRPITGTTVVSLLTGVRSFRLKYFGFLDDDVQGRWHDTWTHPTRLPELVALDIDHTAPISPPRSITVALPIGIQ
jgi:type II secretory pathway pseudopilin PulG